MAVIEMLLGERSQQGLVGGITYDPNDRLLHGVINGASDREPITELRERFAKLKARDNLLGAVCGALGLVDKGENFVLEVVKRLVDENRTAEQRMDVLGGALAGIAKGLGLTSAPASELAAQVLAMNTELTAALSSSQAEVKALTEENAQLRTEAEQERGHKLHAMTAADIAISRAADLEAEVRLLKLSLEARELERVLACARVTGLAAELQEFERAMREKLRT